MLAFALIGLVAIAAMEGVCEMIVFWPIPNPMVEFVRAFVDPDLAIVVGIAYWYVTTPMLINVSVRHDLDIGGIPML